MEEGIKFLVQIHLRVLIGLRSGLALVCRNKLVFHFRFQYSLFILRFIYIIKQSDQYFNSIHLHLIFRS